MKRVYKFTSKEGRSYHFDGPPKQITDVLTCLPVGTDLRVEILNMDDAQWLAIGATAEPPSKVLAPA